MSSILNLIFLLVLLLCGWAGYKKGLIMGIGALLVFVVSVYGADLVSNTFSYEVVDAMRPFAGGYVETEIINKGGTGLRTEMEIDASGLSVKDYLEANPGEAEEFCTRIYEKMGIFGPTASYMAMEALEYADEQAVDIRDAAVEVLCARVAYVSGFVIAFLLIIIILTAVGNIPNISFKIPNMDLVNDISGALLGLVQGVFFCVMLAWALKFTGLVIRQDILADSAVPAWFMKKDFLFRYLGI